MDVRLDLQPLRKLQKKTFPGLQIIEDSSSGSSTGEKTKKRFESLISQKHGISFSRWNEVPEEQAKLTTMEYFVDAVGQVLQPSELSQAPSTSLLAEILPFSAHNVTVFFRFEYVCLTVAMQTKEVLFSILLHDFVESTQHLFIPVFLIIFLIFELPSNQTSLLLPFTVRIRKQVVHREQKTPVLLSERYGFLFFLAQVY